MALFGKKKASQAWHIITSAPKGEAGRQWGDYWFAHDLAEALIDAGVTAKVYSHVKLKDAEFVSFLGENDNVLVLRGLRRVIPAPSPAQWFLWVISHPELIEPGEASGFHKAYAASQYWNPQPELGHFTPLLQATNTKRFKPVANPAHQGILFVGSTRGEYRQIVKDALDQGIPLTLYGVGWDQFIDSSNIAGEFLSNSELPAAYANAALVLNDHHKEMAEHGFLSNRLFDAVAAGARVVSDPALGLAEVFGSSVVQYETPQQLADIAVNPSAYFPNSTVDRDRIRAEHSFAARAQFLIQEAQRG